MRQPRLAILLSLLAEELAWGIASDGLTIDEGVYIGTGYRHVRGDFRLNAESPRGQASWGRSSCTTSRRPPRSRPGREWEWGYALVQRGIRGVADPIWTLAEVVAPLH